MDTLRSKPSDINARSFRRHSSAAAIGRTPSMFTEAFVDFRVKARLAPGHLICVVGSSEELGYWNPLKAKVMKRSSLIENEWHKEMSLTKIKQHLYRFFICKPLTDVQKKAPAAPDNLEVDLARLPGIIICKWETHLEPRVITTSDFSTYGILPVTEFGWITDQYSVSCNEWMVKATEIRLFLSGEQPVKLYEHDVVSRNVGIKCCLTDCGDAMSQTPSSLPKLGPPMAQDAALSRFLRVSSMSLGAFKKMAGPAGVTGSVKCQFQQQVYTTDVSAIRFNAGNSYEKFSQEYNGVTFYSGQSLSFHVYTSASEQLGFRFEFFCEPAGQSRFFGTAFLLPFEKGLSFKNLQTPIFGLDTSCIGQLSLSCLIIRSVPDLRLDMKVSYQNHWKYRRQIGQATPAMDSNVPTSVPRILSLKENTLASLKAAMMQDIQFIELSVQLSKDKIPVIYHDFHFYVSAFNKQCKASEMYIALVKDFTLAKLQSSKLNKYSDLTTRLPHGATDVFDFQPFPSLSAALTYTNPRVGFIIVVKYPQTLDTGQLEVENYFDHNTVVDAVITSVMRNCYSRKVIFSAFDANTCVMLQKKQNKYPVIFRCKAMNPGYPKYKDYRTKSFEAAIQFASLEKLLGVNFLIEELIKDPKLIRKIHNAGLVLFAWSDRSVVRDINRSQIDAAVSEHIPFKLDYGMKREVFYYSNKKEEIDLSHACVVMGIKRHSHSCCTDDGLACLTEIGCL